LKIQHRAELNPLKAIAVVKIGQNNMQFSRLNELLSCISRSEAADRSPVSRISCTDSTTAEVHITVGVKVAVKTLQLKNVRLVSVGILFFAALANAAESDWNAFSDFDNSVSSKEKPRASRAKTKEQPDQFSLIVPSGVVHGWQPDVGAAAAMPRKISENGDAVWTPGIGFQYTSPHGLLLLGAFVKDCYNNPAGTLQVGQSYELSRDSSWAWSVGVYARQTPLDCSKPGVYSGCRLQDVLSTSFVNNINGQFVDIIPLPFLHWTQTVYQSRDLQLNFKLIANGLLNEFGFELPF